MPVLVTGATGFLGGRLAQVLVERGESVRILVRQGSDVRHLAGLKIEVVPGGLRDSEAVRAAVRGVTHIYHCAGCATDWAPLRVYREANVAGLEELLAASIRQKRLERFLHISTTDVYGYPEEPCDESAPLKDIGLPYNSTKCRGEECVREAESRSSLPVTIVRPATIFGPRGKAFTTDVAEHLRRGTMAVIDGGRSRGGFCYVDNAVDGILRAAASKKTVGRAYNLADATGETWRSYVDALARGLGCRRAWIDLPSGAALHAAAALEAAHRTLRLPGRPLLTRHAVYLLSRDQEYPIERARGDFGLASTVSFEEGVDRTLAWLRIAA